MTVDNGMLPRLERRAIWLTLGAAAVALVAPQAGPPIAAGIFGGALIVAVSYWAIKRGVDGIAAALTAGATPRARTVGALIMLVLRYALLALIAYVMISRLRLSPLGLFLGASVIPAAVLIEVLASLKSHGKV